MALVLKVFQVRSYGAPLATDLCGGWANTLLGIQKDRKKPGFIGGNGSAREERPEAGSPGKTENLRHQEIKPSAFAASQSRMRRKRRPRIWTRGILKQTKGGAKKTVTLSN